MAKNEIFKKTASEDKLCPLNNRGDGARGSHVFCSSVHGTESRSAQSGPTISPEQNKGFARSPPTNLDQLFDFVKEEWEKLPKDFFQKLVDSMPRRIRAVIRNHGGSTSY
jgi:hypothetical protein